MIQHKSTAYKKEEKMKKNTLKTIRLMSFITFILYMLETIFIAGIFTNFMLLIILGTLSSIQLVFSIKEKNYNDIILFISYILSAITIVSILY